MTLAAVAADLGQALDVERHAAAQVALHDEVVVDALTDLRFVLVGEVFHTGVRIDAGHLKNLFCAGSADTINIGQANFNSLVLGQVNAGDTCHLIRSFLSKFWFRAQKGRRLTPAGGSRPSGADVLGLTGSDQPCLCLCFGFSQITMTLPLRLMTLHFSHMGLTLGLTFIVVNLLLASPGDAAARQIVRRHLNRDVSQALNHSIGVMTAKDDEAQMSTGAGYTFRNNIYWLSEQYDESRMGSSMFSYLMGYEDPRLSAYFLPVDSKSTQGKEAFDGKQYQAVPAGHLYGKNDEYKMFSKPNIQAATPTYWLRASEVYFLRAEAALIWGGEFGNAEDLYKQGIEMSFQENGISSAVDAYMNSGKTPIKHEVGGSYSCSFAAPCATTVKFEGNTEQKLEKIMIQKWIALFPNGQEAWTEWRRTGYPKLNPVMANRGSSQGVTTEGGIRRMIYPISFYQTADGQKIYNQAGKMLSNRTYLVHTCGGTANNNRIINTVKT